MNKKFFRFDTNIDNGAEGKVQSSCFDPTVFGGEESSYSDLPFLVDVVQDENGEKFCLFSDMGLFTFEPPPEFVAPAYDSLSGEELENILEMVEYLKGEGWSFNL